MRLLSRFLLWLWGWKIIGDTPVEKKYIIIVAPHTSMWDFVIGRIGFYEKGINVNVLIKKELFWFPLGYIIKAFGGIPVERSRNNSTVEYVCKIFRQRDEIVLGIAPEGTRKKVTNWKRGFYHIAMRADVPVYLGYIDYKQKIGGVGPRMILTGNYQEDFKQIELFYSDKSAKFPENFNLTPETHTV